MEDDGHEPETQGARTAGQVRCTRPQYCALPSERLLMLVYGRLAQQTTSAPSGIAQLRQSQDLTNSPDPDPMNLDDFILPDSLASPARIATPSPQSDHAPAPSNAVSTAIPIKKRKEAESLPHPSFVPSAPSQDRPRTSEFGYVQRRVRKTSIDETKVTVLRVQAQ